MVPVPKGYRFGAAAAGFRKEGRLDLAAVVSEVPASAAGVFTRNRFQAAPVVVARERLDVAKTARGIVVNAGQANACTGEDGVADCLLALEMTAERLGVRPEELLPASTGVIGPRLRLNRWRAALPALAEAVLAGGPMDFAKAVMTTDTFPKLAWARIEGPEAEGGAPRECRVLGMCKGAGMISPDMATMLAFVVTDAGVEPELWQEIVAGCADVSFNRVTVDGDTSTNDCLLGLANGMSGMEFLRAGMEPLVAAVDEVCQALAYMIVQDAEGGTRVARIEVRGAKDNAQAALAARAVGTSPLVKTALFGKDPNWGRIVAALGRSGADFAPDEVSVAIGGVAVFERGRPAEGDLRSLLAPALRRQDVPIDISLGDGAGEYVLLASDLSYEYVKINAEYTT